MAQHQSAMKRIRRDSKKTLQNHARIARVRTFIKKVETAVATGDKSAAQTALGMAQPEIMRGVTKGVLHRNTAARKVSRLNAQVAKLAQLRNFQVLSTFVEKRLFESTLVIPAKAEIQEEVEKKGYLY